MNKIYKIGNKEIDGTRINELIYGNDTLENTVNNFVVKNVLIQLLEALSDKEEKEMPVDKQSFKDMPDYKVYLPDCACGNHTGEPKQEEWTDCILCERDKGHIMGNPKVFEGIEHTCTLKQSTSLKEEIASMILWNYQAPINTAERILELLQSHLVKEIETLEPDKYMKMHDKRLDGYTFAKQDIIKIINNIK